MSEDDFIDAEAYTLKNKSPLTFRDIILQHVKKITQYASVEFRGGYWNKKLHPNPNFNITVDEYIPDTREVYSNAIECLHDLLLPHFDAVMLKDSTGLSTELEGIYAQHTIVDNASHTRVFATDDTKAIYRNERVKVCRQLFQALSHFLKRQKYFDAQTIVD